MAFKTGVLADSSSSMDHFKELLEALRVQNESLREDNEMKGVLLANLEGRITDLLTELSEKEAAWCEVGPTSLSHFRFHFPFHFPFHF